MIKHEEYPSVDLNVEIKTQSYKQEGDLAYKYAPLRNLLISEDELNGLKKGQLTDLSTKDLNFKLTNPVNIEVQPSYDGTVNLILNDDINPPRIINSRFTVTEDKKFKIIDRNGDHDTNIYSTENFDLETRLFKNSNHIPYIDFLGLQEGGNLKAGTYSFYFKYVDADGNESDIIAESGIIPVHEGGINDPASISGGILNTNCNKIIKLKISNLDTSYDYLNIYYYRTSGENSFAKLDEYVQILDKKIIVTNELEITITGFENKVTIDNSKLNMQYEIVDKVKTQVQVQNMLFFGNVDKPEIPYKDLTDLSLRMIPSVVNDYDIGYLNEDYKHSGGDLEKVGYYNMKNVYYYTGYWNNEIYRMGVVYILKDDSLSPVFNIRGCDNLGYKSKMKEYELEKVDSNGVRNRVYIPIPEDGFLLDGTAQYENTKGVIRIRTDNNIISNEDGLNTVKPLGIKFSFSNDVLKEIKKFAKGFFFVRQKRIPTILAQGLTAGVDNESFLPCIYDKNKDVVAESFMDQSRILTSNFKRHRLNSKEYGKNTKFKTIFSPEVNVNKLMFTGLFNNSELVLSNAFFDNSNEYLESNSDDDRHFFIRNYVSTPLPLSKIYASNKMIYVPDGAPLKSTGSQYFSALAGMAEDVTKFKYFGVKNKESNANNLIRGIFSSYIGCEKDLPKHKLVNIHIPGYSSLLMKEYFKVRFNSLSSYYAIGNRYDINLIPNLATHEFIEYRGDCYINTVTMRINRNFQDSETPLNNEIIDVNTWKDNYLAPNDANDKKDNSKINRPDVNAVELGHWITFKVCSTFNLALRSLDNSNVDESALMGKPRGFYPAQGMSSKAESKMPESELYNIGYSITSSNKQYVELPDVPYLKTVFDNRIMFSQRHINDAFQNGYRVFQGLQYQDITRQYGAIVKLFDWEGMLFVVFENGVAVLPINERALIQTETGQSVHMYGAGVLPDKETPISVDYGSRWSESIIRTPAGIYGVDTEAKKIWRFTKPTKDGGGFEIISDFKIGKFLNENIKFDSDEHYPIIGLRNVKTHYDNFKGDVIFTFYDCTRNDKVDFNLVFNEKINKWITRTSWTPLTSANINNIFITFNKEVANKVALNAYTLETTEVSEGIVLTSNIYKEGIIGTLSIKGYDYYNDFTKQYNIILGAEYVSIEGTSLIGIKPLSEFTEPVIIKVQVKLNKNDFVAPDFYDYLYIVPENSLIFKEQYLYKHGYANLFTETKQPESLQWYDCQENEHPFEFEFIVNDNPQTQKIFNNLKLISNKTQPGQMQVWVNGDSYDFNTDSIFPTKLDIKNIKNPKYGRLRGNAHYKENIWDIEIKPFKNNKREVRIRDKYVKIRVIYYGKDPAIITAIQTSYTISYA